MKPINQKERNNLYFQFLILYAVSIVVVIFAVGFFYDVNDAAADQLKKTKEQLDGITGNVQLENSNIQKIDSLIKVIESGNELSTAQKSDIEDALDGLKEMKSDIPSLDSLYRAISLRYYSVYDDKVNLRKSGSSEEAVKQLNANLEQAKSELEKVQKEFEMYKIVHPN